MQRLLLGDELGDMMAYAICYTGFPMTAHAVTLAEGGSKRPCICDLNVWNESIERYQAEGAKACWEALGVTEEMMNEGEKEIRTNRNESS